MSEQTSQPSLFPTSQLRAVVVREPDPRSHHRHTGLWLASGKTPKVPWFRWVGRYDGQRWNCVWCWRIEWPQLRGRDA